MSLRPDLRPRILLARLRRRLHFVGTMYRLWTWDYEEMCECETYSVYGVPRFNQRILLIACTCGEEFYRDPEFTEEEQKKREEMIYHPCWNGEDVARRYQ